MPPQFPLSRESLPSEFSFDRLLDLTFDAIIIRDLSDRIFYWNKGAADIYGFTQAEAIGRSPHELLHTEFPVALEEIRAEVQNTGRWSGELIHTCKDGTKLTVSSRWSLSRNAQGVPDAILETNRDVTQYKIVERSLRESEQRLRFHMENTPLAVVEWGPDFRLSRWSGEAERIFGWHADEVLGKAMLEFRWVYEEDIALVAQVGEGLRSGLRPKSVSRNRNYRKDGSVIHCEWYNSSLVDDAGNLVSIFSLVLDVTERDAAELALRESEARFRTVAEAIPQKIWVIDPAGNFRYISPKWLEYVGATSMEQVQGSAWADAIHPDDRQQALDAWRRAAATREPLQVEYRLRGADGTYRWHLARAVPIINPNTNEQLWFGSATDISDQIQRQQELEQIRYEKERSLALLQSFMESAPIGFSLHDAETRYLAINSYLENLNRVPRERCIGLTLSEALPELGPKVEPIMKQVYDTGQQSEFEVQGDTLDPTEERFWAARYFPIKTSNGERIGVGAAVSDITDRKRAERVLRDTEKLAAAGRLAASVAHEINNPLEAVTNLLYLAQNDPSLTHHVRELLKSADEELRRVAHLTHQTLGFYRDSSAPVVIDLAKIINHVLFLFANRADSKHLVIQRQYTPDLRIVSLEGEVRQIVANLYSNALDAVPLNGTITVRTRPARQNDTAGVRITIADNGPGIPEQQRRAIWQPFYTTKESHGTGLGLWVTRELVAKNFGSITLRSRTTPPSYTAFSVFLPSQERYSD